MNTYDTLEKLTARYPALDEIKDNISAAFNIIKETYENGGKLLCCGNGGSCADCDHIVGELMKNFKLKRSAPYKISEKLAQMGDMGKTLAKNLEGALPAISLCGHSALTTAYLNDTNPHLTYAQQLLGYGRKGDTLLALTTSGNSENCLYAAMTAHAMGIKVISMTGAGGGKIKAFSDISIAVSETETYLVQEYHLPIYHCLCAMLEAEFFS